MVKFPELKKKISSFLTKEDGKISKENLIKAGVLLSAAAIASLKSVSAATCAAADTTSGHTDHANDLTLTYASGSGIATGTHCHDVHSSHSSY